MRRRLLIAAAVLALGGCAGTPPQDKAGELAVGKFKSALQDGVLLLRPARGSMQVVTAQGQARIEQPLANEAHTRFLVGSISKWITTVAVLRLVDQGRVDLDKPITFYLPELPRESGRVTVRHLLSNTSGIPNGLAQALKQDRAATENSKLTPSQGALRYGAGAPGFEPGTKFDYSFTNWVLVGAIVEKLTGLDFQQAIKTLVLQPAGVRDTGFANDAWTSMPQAALAYDKEKSKRKMSAMPPMVAASGTVYSTAADLVAIADAVYAGDLLSGKSRAELLTVQHAEENYALGGRVRDIGSGAAKRRVIWNGGVIGGYKTLLVYAPADGAAVVLLNNTDIDQSDQNKLAEALLDELLQAH
ncbi:serine hydrolase domain-containing protein [Massilia aerilata]|uniref:Serine hydrolase domain-containing protein n=1 Tax=Massilia aerilata TaxID=453817 RepID=A0ABW0RW35_9BURK